MGSYLDPFKTDSKACPTRLSHPTWTWGRGRPDSHGGGGGGGGGNSNANASQAKANPCDPVFTIPIPFELQLDQSQALGGIAVSSVTFSQAGPVNGITLSTFSNFSSGGVTVPAFTQVTVQFNGSVLSIGATNPVSLPTKASGISVSADLLEFSSGKVTNVNGSVDLLGVVPIPNGSQRIQDYLNSNGDILKALGGLSDVLGDCNKVNKGRG
jgi:hypothetical protein